MKHPLHLSHGHLVAHLPAGRQLLDTGSPMTFPVPESIRASIGAEVENILGMDWLDGKILNFDLHNGILEVDGAVPAGTSVSLGRRFGVPLVAISHGGRQIESVLDTGAQLSYAPVAVVASGRDPECRTDFYPGFGEFEVETSVVDLQIGSRRVAVRVGALPQGLDALIGAFGLPEWIVGAEIFNNARVCLDLVNDQLVFAATPVRTPRPSRGDRRPLVKTGQMTYQEWKLKNAGRLAFRRYYTREFRSDLAAVLEHSTGTGMWVDAISPGDVSTRNPAIDAMPERRRMHFALALCLTVLTDQVVRTHFRNHYARFHELTRYPKWRSCPFTCCRDLEPEEILTAVGEESGRLRPGAIQGRLDALREVVPEYRREVESFVRDQMPELGAEFWRRCMAEPPLVGFEADLLLLPLRAARYED